MTPFIPPAKPIIGHEERAAVDRVMRSGMLAQGPKVASFETEFSDHFGLGRACVAVNSDTSGLHLGLLSAGVKAGDEVIVPSFTFAATANSVALTGAVPIFADIDPQSFCLDPVSVEAAITERTVGIMPVHLHGHPADMPALQAIADRHGIKIFEVAAQAHGASLNGMPVGAFGSFAMFSLYPTKNTTSGQGGMVVVGEPLAFHELIAAAMHSVGVVTDSGGLQKEAYLRGKTCTTVRAETEWVEALEGGWNVLPPDPERIGENALRSVPTAPPLSVYCDGDASKAVVRALLDEIDV